MTDKNCKLNRRALDQYAERLMRQSFSITFNRLVVALNKDEERCRQAFVKANPDVDTNHYWPEIRSKMSAFNPYKGINIPATIDNTNYKDKIGMTPTTYTHSPNVIVPCFEDEHIRPAIEESFHHKVNAMNDLIGKSFSVREMNPLRSSLTGLWGEAVNMVLPFETGFEPYYGTQYLESLFEMDENGEKFVLKGYTKSKGDHVRLSCELTT